MKPIKLAAAICISLASLTAQAGYFQIAGGINTAVPGNNYYAGDLSPTTYNIGGNLQSSFDGVLSLDFTFLGSEAAWRNTFTSSSLLPPPDNLGGSIDNILPSPSFAYSDDYSIGEAINFIFTTNGSPVPNFVTNGSNTNGDLSVSFATALDTTFNGNAFDAILFFDDTGGYQDDDNHDDLVIGVRVISAGTRSVPEPSSLVLLMSGLVGIFAARRRLKA